MSTLVQDLRFTGRMLRKSPGLTAAAALSLALGIGANTAVFTFVNALLFPTLPVREPHRLISVYTRTDKAAYYLPTSYPNYQDYRRLNTVFADVAAHLRLPLSLGRGQDSERILGEIVTANYFSTLGVTPMLGRAFLPEEDTGSGTGAVAVASHALWKGRFHEDPALVGKQVTLDGHAFTVVGVAPEGFRGTAVGAAVQMWVPMMMHPQVMSTYSAAVDQRRSLLFEVTGRLHPKFGLQEAQAAMRTLARQLEQEYPEANKGRTLSLVPLLQARLNPNARGVVVLSSGFLLVVVGLVLLIACVNLANLMLAKTAARQREIGVRVALGASRGRLLRQFLTESLTLSLLGGVLGLIFAAWATRFLWGLRPPALATIVLDLEPNLRVLLFTLGVAVVTGLAFGLTPALRASRADVVAALKEKEGSLGSGPRHFRMRNVLVVSQVCGSVVLAIVAALFVRSLREAHHIDPGFAVEDVLVMSLEPGLYGYDEVQGQALYRQVVERARGLAGVRSATLAAQVPMGGGSVRTVLLEGREEPASAESGKYVLVNTVGTRYFETVGIPLMQGRDFTDRDREGSPRVAIVNETMAQQYWPGQSALGSRFKFEGQEHHWEVTGIARDSKYSSLGEKAQAFAYVPLEQSYVPGVSLHLRTSGDPAASAAALRIEIQRVDDNVPPTGVQTLREHLSASLWLPRMGAVLLGFFGLIGVVLTVVGLYGVMANAVARRTHEIGIRMALGGTSRHVLALVLKQGMVLVVVGVIVGLAAAAAVTRVLARLLYGVGATDPATFVGAAALLIAVGALATYIPAKYATRVDPMVAVRDE
jgi:predicted permease